MTKQKYFALFHENDIVVWTTDKERRVVFTTREDAAAFAAGLKTLSFEDFSKLTIGEVNLADYSDYVDFTGYKPLPNGDCVNLIKWREEE